MSHLKEIRTSLEVGFPGGTLPEAFANLRGRESRVIGNVAEFPYEDHQFDVVLMSGDAVSAQSVKEAHRVLKPAWKYRDQTKAEKAASDEMKNQEAKYAAEQMMNQKYGIADKETGVRDARFLPDSIHYDFCCKQPQFIHSAGDIWPGLHCG